MASIGRKPLSEQTRERIRAESDRSSFSWRKLSVAAPRPAPAAASTTTTAATTRACLVDTQFPATDVAAIQGLDGGPGLVVVRHLDETETS